MKFCVGDVWEVRGRKQVIVFVSQKETDFPILCVDPFSSKTNETSTWFAPGAFEKRVGYFRGLQMMMLANPRFQENNPQIQEVEEECKCFYQNVME